VKIKTKYTNKLADARYQMANDTYVNLKYRPTGTVPNVGIVGKEGAVPSKINLINLIRNS